MLSSYDNAFYFVLYLQVYKIKFFDKTTLSHSGVVSECCSDGGGGGPSLAGDNEPLGSPLIASPVYMVIYPGS